MKTTKRTDADFRNAICPPELARYRLTDANGLYLEVSPAGSKRWFWKFYPDGKESRLALRGSPGVTLKKARAARDAARKTRKTRKMVPSSAVCINPMGALYKNSSSCSWAFSDPVSMARADLSAPCRGASTGRGSPAQ